MQLLEAFPDYPIDSLPPLPPGWEPTHWRNNSCPSWAAGGVTLWIDYPDAAQREVDGMQRFALSDTDGNDLLQTDDWRDVLAYLGRA